MRFAVSHTASSNRATNVPVTIRSGEKVLKTVTVNQRKSAKIEGGFTSLGVHAFTAMPNDTVEAFIEISTTGTNGVVHCGCRPVDSDRTLELESAACQFLSDAGSETN